MSLRDVARIAELAFEADKARRGDAPARDKLARDGLPALASLAFGPSGATLANIGVELLERRGLIRPDAIEGEYRVLDAAPPPTEGCGACQGRFDPRSEAEIVRAVASLQFGVVIILGRPGTGKTVLSCALAERWDRPTYVIGMPVELLPGERWHAFDLLESELAEIPDGAALLIDDALAWFNARANRAPRLLSQEARLNRQLEDLMAIARHRRLLVAANMQTTRGLEPGLLIACEALALKPPSLVWGLLERPDSLRLWEPAVAAFAGMPPAAIQRHVYVMTHQARGLCHVAAPPWYSDQISMNKAKRGEDSRAWAYADSRGLADGPGYQGLVPVGQPGKENHR